jgi:hypothetical protein
MKKPKSCNAAFGVFLSNIPPLDHASEASVIQ